MESIQANVGKTLHFLAEHSTTIAVSTTVFLLLSSINAGKTSILCYCTFIASGACVVVLYTLPDPQA